MSDWLHNLPVLLMALVVFGLTYLVAAAIHSVVAVLAVGERARSFKAVSPGMPPPLGIIFGLFVAFTAAQVWNDTERANGAVNREASALRSVVILAASFPGEPEVRLRALIRRYIEEAATQEWPMMARHTATLGINPRALGEALQLTLLSGPATWANRPHSVRSPPRLKARWMRVASAFSPAHPKSIWLERSPINLYHIRRP